MLQIRQPYNYKSLLGFCCSRLLDEGRPLALSGLFSKHLPPGMPWLQNPFFISNNNTAPKVRVTVGEGAPASVTSVWVENLDVPFSPLISKQLGNKGDIHFNRNPYDDGGYNRYLAWICTSSFELNIANIDASVAAIWKPFWLVNF
mgnify:CR=1 FL=1